MVTKCFFSVTPKKVPNPRRPWAWAMHAKNFSCNLKTEPRNVTEGKCRQIDRPQRQSLSVNESVPNCMVEKTPNESHQDHKSRRYFGQHISKEELFVQNFCKIAQFFLQATNWPVVITPGQPHLSNEIIVRGVGVSLPSRLRCPPCHPLFRFTRAGSIRVVGAE